MNKFVSVSNLVDWINALPRFKKICVLDKVNYLMSKLKISVKDIKCIHVAGTNGKGSTVAYLKNCLLKSGLNVGTFISPHVLEFNERITYNNSFISDFDLLEISNYLYDNMFYLKDNLMDDLSFFEFITCVSFIYFTKYVKPDIVIFETGLGGEFDATNIILPYCSIITNVSYDHQNVLGYSLEKILHSKLGIVKQNVPLFTFVKDNHLKSIIKEYCSTLNSDVYFLDEENITILKNDLISNKFLLNNTIFETSLIGTYQVENAVCAIKVLQFLQQKKSNFNISYELLYEGIKTTFWPGRFEKISSKPLIYLDGGHNIGCINQIVDFLNLNNLKDIRLVLAFSKDKDYQQMISKLDNFASEIILTKYNFERSVDLSELLKCNIKSKVYSINNVSDTIEYLYDNPTNFTLIIGSLYLISEARNIILKK